MSNSLLKYHLPIKFTAGQGVHLKKRSTKDHIKKRFNLLYKHSKHALAHKDMMGQGVSDLNINEPLEMARTRNAGSYKSLKFRI